MFTLLPGHVSRTKNMADDGDDLIIFENNFYVTCSALLTIFRRTALQYISYVIKFTYLVVSFYFFATKCTYEKYGGRRR